jgi:ABC-type sugar transport system ATPase subunit
VRLKQDDREIGLPSLPISPDALSALGSAGMEATLGVRPESIELRREQVPGAVRATVQLLESMGSLNWLFLALDGIESPDIEGGSIVAVVRSAEQYNQGANVWLNILADRLILFHPKSGQTIATLQAGRWEVFRCQG